MDKEQQEINDCLEDLQKKGAKILNVKVSMVTREPEKNMTIQIYLIEYEASKRIY